MVLDNGSSPPLSRVIVTALRSRMGPASRTTPVKVPGEMPGGSVDAVVGGREAGACDVGSGGGGGDGGAAARSTFPMV